MDIKLNLGLQLLITCLSVALNIAGLVAIYSYKKKTNQNLILACLSIAEIVSPLLDCVLIKTRDPILTYIGLGLQWVFSFSIFLNMFALTLDRFICILNPLKYKTRLTRKRMILILIVVFVTSIVNGVYSSIAGYFLKLQIKYFIYIGHALNIGFILFSIMTYGLAFYTARTSMAMSRPGEANESASMRKLFLVPGVIIGTYFLFYSIPNLVSFDKILKFQTDFNPVIRLVMQVGFILDPLTYIFFCKHYRDAFMQKMRTCISWNSRVDSSLNDTEMDSRN